MGQRLSKTTVNSCKVFERKQHNSPHTHHNISTTNSVHAIAENIVEIYEESPKRGLQIPATAKVNADNIYSQKVQIHHTPIEDLTTTTTNSTPPLSSSCSRQIIIKIQLAKMENECQQQQAIHVNGNTDSIYSNNSKVFTSTPSSNNKIGSGQFLNVTFNQNLLCNGEGELRMATGALMSSESLTNSQKTTLNENYSQQDVANSSPRIVVNNNFSSNIVVATTPSSTGSENFNILMTPMNELQMNEAHLNVVNSNSSGEMMMVSTANDRKASTTAGTETVSPGNGNCVEDAASIKSECCCRRKSRSSNTFPQKWRCCKCTCRDAIKRILDVSSPSCAFTNTSTSKSSKKKDRKETRENSKSPKKQGKQQEQLQHSSQQSTLWTTLQPNSPQLLPGSDPPAVAAVATTAGNTTTQMSIWSPNRNDVIIPISSPQFVVLQCPPSSLVTLGRFDDNAIRLMATELVTTNASATGNDRTNCQSTQLTNQLSINARQADLNDLIVKTAPVAFSAPASSSVGTTSSVATPTVSTCASTVATNTAGPVVHSQVDYMHCLVPDLERITKASFYWGKMDRYEAERLLEGKPEGTFLLRDSAQEEYLFSVTFRKYGRSLHARIEQSNHKFSFDCHDPCVFTAPTVTGLLEHYKDPACVMFFEPSLTIPLHRNTTFSLQELCRATIVSHTNYDGINELELPSRLKSYLKEYHYKQKLRVKPIDEPFYTCT